MDNKLIAIIVAIVFFASLPLVCQLLKDPEPLTVEKMKQVYRDQGFSVANERTQSRPRFQADAEEFMTINGARVHVFTYSNLDVIDRERTNMEIDAQRGLPAYAPKNVVTTVRNKHFVMLIVSDNASLRERIARVFEGLRNPGPPPRPPEEPQRQRRF